MGEEGNIYIVCFAQFLILRRLSSIKSAGKETSETDAGEYIGTS